MVKKRYFAVVGIASVLFMLYALYDIYMYYLLYGYGDEYPFIIAGALTVASFAYSAFALIYSLKKSRLLLDIAVGLNTAISICCYALQIDEEPIYGVIGLVGAIIICAFYFVGIWFKCEAQNKQYLFDVCCVLAFCVIGACFIWFYSAIALVVSSIVALVIFMIYCFVKTNRNAWYIVAGVAGVVCLALCIYGFVTDIILIGFIALAGVAYTIVYFVISYMRNRSAGYTNKGGLSSDDIKQLEQLHELMLQGIITEEQFQIQKDKILGGK